MLWCWGLTLGILSVSDLGFGVFLVSSPFTCDFLPISQLANHYVIAIGLGRIGVGEPQCSVTALNSSSSQAERQASARQSHRHQSADLTLNMCVHIYVNECMLLCAPMGRCGALQLCGK